MTSLQGRRVLVTGANRGIGAELVRAALARGARTVLAGTRDPESFQPAAGVVPVRLDVTIPDEIRAAAADHPDVDLIVSNAGVACYRPLLGGGGDDDAEFARAMDVNFVGPMHLIRAYADSLRRPDAGIVFVLSVGAVALSRSSPIYSASKAACLMMALAAREELRETGAHVTVVLPGFVDTEMSTTLQMPKAPAADVAGRILDGWSAGEPTVWPDRFAEVVRETVGPAFERLLDDPRAIMTGVQREFLESVEG